MTRIVVLSDPHLSPTHGFFWNNWVVARDAANALAPDAVVVNGDLCINGPDSDIEVAFAAAALARIKSPVLALPGNHDIGDEPPGQDAKQLVDAPRLQRWYAAFKTDRWSLALGDWGLIGVNAQLFGSGLKQEAEQEAWLDAQLADAAGRNLALFLHKPLFIDHEGESEPTIASLNLEPRLKLLAKLRKAGVQLVVNGHLHQFRDRVVDGIRHVWAPSTAFVTSQPIGGDPRLGMLTIDVAQAEPMVEVLRPAGMTELDLATIKGHGRYKFLRDMPACPPQAA
jgi:3',5'-cyclic AMP phosphodiesterase CpdA